ncbi:MAG: ABC transporter permease [Gemmatimonadota bacterium]
MSHEHSYPALGPKIWAVLLRNEWFKARHRLAFVVTLGMYVFINTMTHGQSAYDALQREDREFGLPDAWSAMFGGDSILLLIFASIAIIMLTSSEFTWRTSRQNVIDGVGKMQWFWGKVILLVLVGIVFLASKLVVGVAAAMIGTDFSAGEQIFPLSAFAASGALLIAYLNAGGLALLVSLSARAAGPAMALWFFWITMGEQLLPAILGRIAPSLQPAFAYLPFAATQQVLGFALFDERRREQIIAGAAEAGQAAPDFADPMLWTAVNAGWAILFLTVAYLIFRKRDL